MGYEQDILEGQIHAGTRKFAAHVDFALDGIEKMVSIAPRCYLSLSFGKQSICLAHMIYQVAPKIEMHFLASEETWMMYDYEIVIDKFLAKCPVNLVIHQTKRFSEGENWKDSRDKGDQDLQNMCPREKWDGWFWGLSMDESKGRKKTLIAGAAQSNLHPTIFRYSDGKYRCCPIMLWTIRELAAYIWQHEIPLLNIYLRFGLAQRTTARATKKMILNQGMNLVRMTSSKGFRQMVNRFPEINIQ